MFLLWSFSVCCSIQCSLSTCVCLGCVVVWLCSCVVVWLCGCVIVWLCDCVVVWLCLLTSSQHHANCKKIFLKALKTVLKNRISKQLQIKKNQKIKVFVRCLRFNSESELRFLNTHTQIMSYSKKKCFLSLIKIFSFLQTFFLNNNNQNFYSALSTQHLIFR